MNETELTTYYNKFNEDKRFNSRHGQVEFITTTKYIEEYLKNSNTILDIGAGTGAYSLYFENKGYDVTAIELIKHNMRVIESKLKKGHVYQGNAINLFKETDETYDIVLLLGPMYHLISYEEKLKALNEAKRVLKKGGILFVAYIMNDYAILTHGFKERNILNSLTENKIDENYHITPKENDLYSYVRLEDIDRLNKDASLKRIKIISPDGPANHMRASLNSLSEEEFQEFIKYHLHTCERPELLGAAAHTLDILTK